MTGSVPLCVWVWLALLLGISPLGADEKMDSSLIKGAAAGVRSPWWGVGSLLILLRGKAEGGDMTRSGCERRMYLPESWSPFATVTLVF